MPEFFRAPTGEHHRRERQDVEATVERALDRDVDLVAVGGREKSDPPEVDREDRHAGPRVRTQGPERSRRRRPQHDRDVGAQVAVRPQHELDPGALSRFSQCLDAPCGLVRAVVGDDAPRHPDRAGLLGSAHRLAPAGSAASGSATRAAATRSSTRSGTPPAHQMKLSRFPAGPGWPEST